VPLQPGSSFGRYKLAELLGKGGMGEVYRAQDTVLNRSVALKVLTAAPDVEGASASSQGAARILREARSAAGITHPNAVAIYDVGEVDGVPFLAMELVAGRTLRTYVGDTSVPLGRRIRWLVDVALALGAAHQLGLVHRDIKPENVMVGDDGFVKVLDFGIARRAIAKEEPVPPSGVPDLAALEAHALANTLTADGVIAGTPMYMAPEQLRGAALDGRADQFAWGVLAYELLTGKQPWVQEWPLLLTQILSREIPPLTQAVPEIPERVDEIVRRALQKSAASRFETMEEIARELDPFAAAARGGASGRGPLSARAREALVNAPTVSISSGGDVVTAGASARTQADVGPEGRSRSRRGAIALAAAALAIAAVAIGVGVSRRRAPVAMRAVLDAAPVAETPTQMSPNAEATAAYVGGMDALRKASFGSARRQLEHAVELDPLFAAAHLRLAIEKALDFEPITSAELQPARDSRASLGEHDRILLEAIEPCGLAPPDWKESQRRFEAAVAKYPADPDFHFQLAIVLDESSQPARAIAELDAAIAGDPGFALAWWMRADLQIETDDAAGAFESYAQCLKVSPGATTCLSEFATLQSNAGKCEELVSTSRKLVTLAPTAARAYERLAEGLAGSGHPLGEVRAALQQQWDHEPESERRLSQLKGEASLEILVGDLAGAERRYEEAETLIASSSDGAKRLGLVYPRMLIEVEVGHFALASHLAEVYLRQRAAWSSPGDDSLSVEAVELAAGTLSRAKFEALREQWLTRNRDMPPGPRWVGAYALPATTRGDAVAALATKPDVHPLLNALFMFPEQSEPIGRTYVLAGELDEGIPLLSQASSACVLDAVAPIFATWAAFDLGEALETRGDASGACAAYQRVLTRWGTATPPSRTAAKAVARRRALTCGAATP
jgi:serine/threonine-protein kinase